MASQWRPRAKIERRYKKALKLLTQEIARRLGRLSTQQDVVKAALLISESKWFNNLAVLLSYRLVESVAVESAKEWREAAKKCQGWRGRRIYEGLKEDVSNNIRYKDLAQQNAQLIKTIPQTMANKAISLARKQAVEGKRFEEIVPKILADNPMLAEWQAQRIARTEVAKTQAAITQSRCEEIGVDWYAWQTSQDERVRSSHHHMQGVVCQFSSPPAPEALIGVKSSLGQYNPGECPNCRCYAAPILDADDETWPKKVQLNGKIQTMSKKQFLALVPNSVPDSSKK